MTVDANYVAALRRSRRRAILEILLAAPENAGDEVNLEPVLEARRIYASDRGAIRAEIVWLAEQGFVAMEDVGGVYFCKLLPTGESIAKGKRVHPDIAKPTGVWNG